MREPHSEGVVNHADLESCAGDGDIAGEALTEALAGRLLSREIPRFGCRPCGQKGKATSIAALSQATSEPGAVGDPGTSGNSLRENRETSEASAAKRQAGGGRREPYAPHVRRRGVGPGRSTCEGSEQGRETVGEELEGRAGTEENVVGCATDRTQRRTGRAPCAGRRAERKLMSGLR